MALLLVAIVSVCITSCKGDGGEEPDSIIGTWKYTIGSNEYVLLTFSEDGTVIYSEYENGRTKSEEMTYTYKKGVLSFYSYGKSNPETARVIRLTSSELILQNWPENGNCTFTKNGTISPSLIGTWKYTTGSSKQVMLTFRQDGTVIYREYNNGRSEEEEMTYTYKKEILSFYSYGKSNPETARVIRLTSSELILQDWPDRGNCIFYKQ